MSGSRAARRGLVVAFVAMLAVLAGPAAGGATKPKPIFWKSYGKPAVIEPSRIDIDYATGGAWADHLSEWEGWGTARATAEGVIHLNTCRPYCAAGNFKAYKGRVTLFKVRHCRAQRRYVDIKVVPENQPKATWGSNCAGAQIVAP
ncbi:MAG TPA: hypothetical protein VHA54_12385 [Solirubrobacterales bacterium]|nr:hypothetical protein [Solirubrobacterales bacterium]